MAEQASAYFLIHENWDFLPQMRASFMRNQPLRLFGPVCPLATVVLLIGWVGPSSWREASAGDWPQVLGPLRNGVAADESLLPFIPEKGLDVLWKHEVGEGFAGPAILGNRAVVHHRVGRQEVVDCLELGTGKVVWSAKLPANYQPGINPDAGPRCVPTLLKNGTLITFSPSGQLTCLAMDSGRVRWTRSLFQDYSGDENYFGAGSTPLVIGDRILVNVGGRRGAGIVAVTLQDGKSLWQSTEEGTSYASPIEIDWGRGKAALFVTRLTTVGIDPESGEVLFEFPFGKRGATVNAAMPLETPQGVLLSASYGVGAKMIRPAAGQPAVVWENEDALSSQYFTSVYHKGFLYGVDGREDFQNTRLRCVDATSGEVQWTKDGVPGGHLILVGDQILMVDIEGGLRSFDADPKRYRSIWEAPIHKSPGRSLPAYSKGLLLVRTNAAAGRGTLTCAVVGERP